MPTYMRTYPENLVKIGPGHSEKLVSTGTVKRIKESNITKNITFLIGIQCRTG